MEGTIIVEGEPVETPTPTPTDEPDERRRRPTRRDADADAHRHARPGATATPDDHTTTPAPGQAAAKDTRRRVSRARARRRCRGRASCASGSPSPRRSQIDRARKGKRHVTSADAARRRGHARRSRCAARACARRAPTGRVARGRRDGQRGAPGQEDAEGQAMSFRPPADAWSRRDFMRNGFGSLALLCTVASPGVLRPRRRGDLGRACARRPSRRSRRSSVTCRGSRSSSPSPARARRGHVRDRPCARAWPRSCPASRRRSTATTASTPGR